MITVDTLPNLHTKVLLNALKFVRSRNSCEGRIIDYIRNTRPFGERFTGPVTQEEYDAWVQNVSMIVDALYLGGKFNEESTVTICELKAELAKRPHVPNKQESRILRIKRKTQGGRRGRRDR